MLSRTLLFGAVLAAGLSHAAAADLPSTRAPTPAAPVPFFFVNDTQISVRFEPNAKEPGVTTAFRPNGISIPKVIFGITHFDVWQYGTNFANIDFLKSSNRDPSNGSLIGQGDGAFEVYGLYRGTLSFNSLSNSKMFAFGPIKDVSLGFGFDANTKNTTFAPQKRDIVVGPQISFNVPGVLTFQANLYKEWNHCGLIFCDPGFTIGGRHNVDFRATAEFETVYSQPLDFTGLPLTFSGFTNVVLPKGRNGDTTQTKTEVLTSNRLTLDLGQLIWSKPRFVDAFVGYKYWLNKFGNDHRLLGGSIESTVFFGLSWHAL